MTDAPSLGRAVPVTKTAAVLFERKYNKENKIFTAKKNIIFLLTNHI